MQTPWGDFPVSDAHIHFFSRCFYDWLGAQCGKSAPEVASVLGWDLPPEDPAEGANLWAAELDRHGVGRSALIASFPGDEPSVAAALAPCPSRFYGYFMLDPLQDDAAPRVRSALAHGLRGVCLFPAMHRYSVNDPRIRPVFEEAAAARAAVFVHAGVLTVGVRRKLGLASPFDMRFSNPIDLHPVAQRYPDTPFLVPHFGAGYLRETLMLADLCPNVFLDTSSSNSWMRYEGIDLKTVFRRALDTVGARRLLFGTDSSFFPRGWNYEIFDRQTRALLDLGISGADARLILGENLERVFS
jgi:uncharacterized protein